MRLTLRLAAALLASAPVAAGAQGPVVATEGGSVSGSMAVCVAARRGVTLELVSISGPPLVCGSAGSHVVITQP